MEFKATSFVETKGNEFHINIYIYNLTTTQPICKIIACQTTSTAKPHLSSSNANPTIMLRMLCKSSQSFTVTKLDKNTRQTLPHDYISSKPLRFWKILVFQITPYLRSENVIFEALAISFPSSHSLLSKTEHHQPHHQNNQS